MKRLCIIPCGLKKIWDSNPDAAGPYPAKQVYTGALHRKCQAYARLFFDDWVILSAKHGFLLPGDEVPDNYDVAFGTKHPDLIPLATLAAQAQAKGLDRHNEIIVLGGKKFTLIIPQVFGSHCRITYPLTGTKGIGHMLQKLDAALKTGQPL